SHFCYYMLKLQGVPQFSPGTIYQKDSASHHFTLEIDKGSEAIAYPPRPPYLTLESANDEEYLDDVDIFRASNSSNLLKLVLFSCYIFHLNWIMRKR
ncbi:hypothetical protein L9F63_025924, partial [Diploptera punctata]